MSAAHPVWVPQVGAYVRTAGGGTGRIVDRQVVLYTVWWTVKLDKEGALMRYRAHHLFPRD